MPKINVYLPDELAAAVRDAQLPVSAICQSALERAVRDVGAVRGSDGMPAGEPAYGPYARFTDRARAVLALATASAREHRHAQVDTEHLLLGILDEGSNLAVAVLMALELEPRDVRAELIGSLPPAAKKTPPEVPLGPLANKVLEQTTKEALALGHNYIGCEHLLLGLLATEGGLASQVLRRMGVEFRTTRRAVATALVGVVHQARQDTPAGPSPLDGILRRLEAIEQRLPGTE